MDYWTRTMDYWTRATTIFLEMLCFGTTISFEDNCDVTHQKRENVLGVIYLEASLHQIDAF